MEKFNVARHSLALCLLGLLLLALAGCGESRAPTMDQMYVEERKLPALYLTQDTNQQVIAPGDRGVFVDEKTGELAWPALACHNPACPGRIGGQPLLFIAPDPAVVILPDGELGHDRSRGGEIDNYHGNCPKCREIRNLKAESDEDRRKYAAFIQPHVLPATQKRRDELAAERQKREEQLRRRMGRTDR